MNYLKTNCKALYHTSRMIPGVQRYHDYPLAFNIEHIRTKIQQLLYDTKYYLAYTKAILQITKRKYLRERRINVQLQTYSKRLEAWIYSSVAVRIFAFESNDNCSCPWRMIFNNSSFERFTKPRGNNIAFTLFRRSSLSAS